jgi:ADP-ribose pyrophosphatase YjhB (NUDIX family)
MGKVQGRFEGTPFAEDGGAELVQLGVVPLVACPDGVTRVVLVTSRGSGRWTIPKGNPIAGLPPHKSAAREALEEAGLIGKTAKKPLGSYRFWKRREDHWTLASVDVHLMRVEERRAIFKEAAERSTGLFTIAEASALVVEPGLKTLIEAAGLVDAARGEKRRGKGRGKGQGKGKDGKSGIARKAKTPAA